METNQTKSATPATAQQQFETQSRSTIMPWFKQLWWYKIKIKHDTGSLIVNVKAQSEESAILSVMKAQSCPRHAIVKVVSLGNTRDRLKDKRARVREYIYSCISIEGYDSKTAQVVRVNPNNKADQIRFLAECFLTEKVHGEKRVMWKHSLFIEWLQDLPSSFNVEYRYDNIELLMIQWGYLRPNYSEKQLEKALESYWLILWREFYALCTHYEIKLS